MSTESRDSNQSHWTFMDADVFDTLMASLETADESPELESLAQLPKLLSR